MFKRRSLVLTLAVIGTVLLWTPIVAPILFSLAAGLTRRGWHLDTLMPAELFPIVLVGGGALIAAALWARALRMPITGAVIGSLVLLASTQAFAEVTGLANRKEGHAAWVLPTAQVGLAGYVVLVVASAILGGKLVRRLVREDDDEGRLPSHPQAIG